MSNEAIDSKKHSFEEFKLFYESTERVTDRRIQTNRWNYSICIAILIAIASLAKWALSNSAFFFTVSPQFSYCALWLHYSAFCG